MTDKDRRKPIAPPAQHKTRDVTRAIVEGATGIVPGGGIVIGGLRVLAPSRTDRERDAWQQEISARSNEQDARLDRYEDMIAPTEVVEGLAAQILVRLAQDCPDGLGNEYYELDDLCLLFPDESKQSVKDAVFDLKALGLLASNDWIGGWSVSLDTDTYKKIDKDVMGWDTLTDAITIARLMLSEDTGHAPELHDKTGWSKRRFNPAFRLLLPLFPEGRTRTVIQHDYPVLGVVLSDEDKAKLRRFVT